MTKVALVTGGQRGIGLGVSKALADAGYRVAMASLPSEDSDAAKDAVAMLGADNACYFQQDLRDIGAVEKLLDRVEGATGPVTTLVSNAGVPAKVRGDMLDITPEDYQFVMDINLSGAFFLAQACARRMILRPENPYRSIQFVTSVSADMVSIERAEYCMSKSGAAMMAQLFAARLANEGIGVFELRPGIIATDMTAGVEDKYTARIEDGLVPARRWGVPEDIAQVVLSLAEGHMRFATGAVIPVDGGLFIHRL